MHLPESLQDLADSETVRFLKRPKSISRVCGGVFSLVIFSSLLIDGYQNRAESPELHCVFNRNYVACALAVRAGFLSFLSSLVFLALDAHENRIIESGSKTAFRLLDFILAVIWAGVWFGAFCFLANQWQQSDSKHFLTGNSSPKAAIAFAFFSVPVWIFQAYLAFQDLRNEAPFPYKRSQDEGAVVLNTLSPSSTSSPADPPTTGPNSVSYSSSALSPYLTTPKAPRLAMMPDS
ncbi:synaptogyrin-4 isoform X1 [Alexandromys fortis]|uniref:synaptogyrin-4 isoform X1 n=1 Tax=Alexandromys fortis TaxID=100897 RepID=UPI002152B20C|nr:synaptogyrin-4 isoform X1 [Microtus fortis]XP_049977167.1 synaptogyrin-4 isoform X1 [Microtus fortis]XP_049977168.1 synaptogyrin-4 isoform X1 [Microtus fortis]XP_049977169.1 synaptogyrin-4 isoform X1 [Microtus fortis]